MQIRLGREVVAEIIDEGGHGTAGGARGERVLCANCRRCSVRTTHRFSTRILDDVVVDLSMLEYVMRFDQ